MWGAAAEEYTGTVSALFVTLITWHEALNNSRKTLQVVAEEKPPTPAADRKKTQKKTEVS